MYKFNIMIPKELASVEAIGRNGSNSRSDAIVPTRNRFDALSERFRRQESNW